MALESRYAPGFQKEATDAPGIILDNDGLLWGVRPDGTRYQLEGGGGGCVYLTCASEVAELRTAQSLIVGENAGDGATASLSTIDQVGSTRTYVEGIVSDTDDSSQLSIGAQDTDAQGVASIFAEVVTADHAQTELVASSPGVGNNSGIRFEAVESDGYSKVRLYADRLSFNNDTPIQRPTLNPATATAQQVAQALIDLGLAVGP